MITSATKKLVRKAETIISALEKSISVAEMSVSRTDINRDNRLVEREDGGNGDRRKGCV